MWDSYGQDPSSGSGYGVHGQRFDSAGAIAGSEFQINTYTTANQHPAAIAADAAGDFVVVWASGGQDGDSFGMFGQRLCQDANSNVMCDSQETTTTSILRSSCETRTYSRSEGIRR